MPEDTRLNKGELRKRTAKKRKPRFSQESPDSVTLLDMSWRILSLNIEGDKHFDTVLPFLQAEKPDIMCLQEVFEADIPKFVEATGYSAAFVPIVEYTQPNQYDISPRGKWGVLTLTAEPTQDVQTSAYKGTLSQVPVFVDGQPNSANRAFLAVAVGPSAQPLWIVNTHFTWSGNGQANEDQRQDVVTLLSALQPYSPLVLCGDFNAPRGREIFSRLADRYIDHIPPEVTTTIDGQFHYAGQLELVVDGFFTTPQVTVESIAIQAGLSDHTATVATVHLNQKGTHAA